MVESSTVRADRSAEAQVLPGARGRMRCCGQVTCGNLYLVIAR
jgi:hypothetical protein